MSSIIFLDRFEGLYKEQGYKTESYLSKAYVTNKSFEAFMRGVQAVDKFSKIKMQSIWFSSTNGTIF